MALGFAELIAPTTEVAFFAEVLHRRPLFLPGARDRFAGLFSWDDLNRALSRNRLEFPRLRLVRESEALEPARYTERVSVGGGRTAARAGGLKRKVRRAPPGRFRNGPWVCRGRKPPAH